MCLPSIIVLLVACLFSVQSLGASAVSTRDGLCLTLAANGVVAGLSDEGRELLLGTGGGFSVEDFAGSFTRLPGGAAAIPNAGFEEAEGDGARGWQPQNWGGTLDVRRGTQRAHGGAASLRMHGDSADGKWDNNAARSGRFPVKAGQYYAVSTWLLAETGQSPAAKMDIWWLDGQGKPVLIPGAKQNYHSTPAFTAIGRWLRFEDAAQAPPGAAQAEITINLMGDGTVYFDDVAVEAIEPPSVPVPLGTLSRKGKSLVYKAELQALKLGLSATYEALPECVRITGKVRDLSGKDRALIVRWRLPVDPSGWRWENDPRNSQPIEKVQVYRNTQQVGAGRQWSLYPLCSLSSSKAGLTLAVPMDWPRVHQLSYTRTDTGGYLEVAFELGLSRDTRNFPGEANFRFVLYRHDPAWGFRAALQKYYRLFPKLFVKRTTKEGIWFLGLREDLVPRPEDFGFMFDEGPQSVPFDNLHGIYSFVYCEPGVEYFSFGNHPTATGRPSYGPYPKGVPLAYEQVVERVKQAAEKNDPRALSILASAITREDGRFVHNHWTDEWSKDNWASNFTVSPAMEIPGYNRGRFMYEHEIEPCFKRWTEAGLHLDGIYNDGLVGYIGDWEDNYRREHWASATVPLVFSHRTRQPVQHHIFASYQYAECEHRDNLKKGRLMMVNGEPFLNMISGHLYAMHGGGESSSDKPDSYYLRLRAAAYQKPVSFMDYTYMGRQFDSAGRPYEWDIPPEKKEANLRKCLFYGCYPGTGSWNNKEQIEALRPLFRKYVPLIQEIGLAGWEPVTGARSSDPAVFVERYGNAGADSLHFTLYNSGQEAKQVVLRVEPSTLGLKQADLGRMRCEEQISGQPLVPRWGRDSIELPFTVAAGDVKLMRMVTPAGIARVALRRALDEAATAGRLLETGKQAVAEGLIRNGGFERGTQGWGFDGQNGKDAEEAIVSEGAAEGTKCVHIASRSEKAYSALGSYEIPLIEGHSYTLAFRYRREITPGQAKQPGTVRARMGVAAPNHEWLFKDYINWTDLKPQTKGWESYQTTFTVPKRVVVGFFQWMLSGNFGQAWFDAVKLVENLPPGQRSPSQQVADIAAALRPAELVTALERTRAALTPGSGNAAAVASLREASGRVRAALQLMERENIQGPHRDLRPTLLALQARLGEAVSSLTGLALRTPPELSVVPGEQVRLRAEMAAGASKTGPVHFQVTSPPGWTTRAEGPVDFPGLRPSGSFVGEFLLSCPTDTAIGRGHQSIVTALISLEEGQEPVVLSTPVELRVVPAIGVADIEVGLSGSGRRQRIEIPVANNSQLPLDAEVTLRFPEGWQLPEQRTRLTLASGQSGAARFELTVPAEAKPGEGKAAFKFTAGGRHVERELSARMSPAIVVPRITAPPLVGKLDPTKWMNAARVSGFREYQSGQPVSQDTVVCLGYDQANLYIGFECLEDQLSGVRQANTARDGDLWLDDCVEVFLDVEHRRTTYYHLVVNAAGARYDAYAGDRNWNGEWKAVTERTDRSWVAMLAVPFRTLTGSTPKPGEVWSLNLCREETPHGEVSCWSPTLGSFHTAKRFGDLVFGE